MALPLISVVIPVYNGELFVADAIESALAQSGASFEVVVIDDGSLDGTPAILDRYRDTIRLFRQPNGGEGAARNAALPHLRSELVVFLDADDLLPSGYLERFAVAADEATEAEVFHCGWRGVRFDDDELLYFQEEPLAIDDDPFHELPVLGSPPINSLLVRRSALEKVGGFKPHLRVQADWDFCLRLAAGGAQFRGVPGNVAVVRRRADSVSRRRRDELVVVGLTVLEGHLAGHARCPACSRADEGLRLWRTAVLRAETRRLAGRIGVGGGAARWIGASLAVVRRPRLIRVALTELADRWRRR